jgi:hypothetical protein
MSDAVVRGSCLCGAVRFSAQLPSLFCGHCHCTMCQRNHGAGFVTWFAVPRDRFALIEGEDALETYLSSEHGTRKFCRRCGSSLLCESSHHPNQVDIPLANVDGPIDRPPQAHVYFDDRASWVEVADGLPRLGGTTGMEPVGSDSES